MHSMLEKRLAPHSARLLVHSIPSPGSTPLTFSPSPGVPVARLLVQRLPCIRGPRIATGTPAQSTAQPNWPPSASASPSRSAHTFSNHGRASSLPSTLLKVCFFCTLHYTNRQDRASNQSGPVTAVLPHNYVSLDSSRRVTQRMRAHYAEAITKRLLLLYC